MKAVKKPVILPPIRVPKKKTQETKPNGESDAKRKINIEQTYAAKISLAEQANRDGFTQWIRDNGYDELETKALNNTAQLIHLIIANNGINSVGMFGIYNRMELYFSINCARLMPSFKTFDAQYAGLVSCTCEAFVLYFNSRWAEGSTAIYYSLNARNDLITVRRWIELLHRDVNAIRDVIPCLKEANHNTLKRKKNGSVFLGKSTSEARSAVCGLYNRPPRVFYTTKKFKFCAELYLEFLDYIESPFKKKGWLKVVETVDVQYHPLTLITTFGKPAMPQLEPELAELLNEPAYGTLCKALIKNGILTLADFRSLNLWTYMNSRNLYSISMRTVVNRDIQKKLAETFGGEISGKKADAPRVKKDNHVPSGGSGKLVSDNVSDPTKITAHDHVRLSGEVTLSQPTGPAILAPIASGEHIADLAHTIKSNSYAHTSPVTLRYREEIYPEDKWVNVCVDLCKLLLNDFEPEMRSLMAKRAERGLATWLANESCKREIREPKKFAPGCYFDAHNSATGFVSRIRQLCLEFGIVNQIEIRYRNTDSAYTKPKQHPVTPPPIPEPVTPPTVEPAKTAAPPLAPGERVVDLARAMKQGQFTGCKPVALVYKGEYFPDTKWTGIYVLFCQLLLRDYEREMRRCIDVDGEPGIAAQFANEAHKDRLRSPKLFAPGCYLESNNNPPGFMIRIRQLCQAFGLLGQVEIRYRSNGVETTTPTTRLPALDVAKNFACGNGGIFSLPALAEHMRRLGLDTTDMSSQLKLDTEPIFLYYSGTELVLVESLGIDDDWLDDVRGAMARLPDHIIPRQIHKNWYALLPALPGHREWTPLMLQQVLRVYGDELGARTIPALKGGQRNSTLDCMLVKLDSPVRNFPDVVVTWLTDSGRLSAANPVLNLGAEQLRQQLIDDGLLAGNDILPDMPKALANDPRFIWNRSGGRVTVSL